jgi:hypothetical protein
VGIIAGLRRFFAAHWHGSWDFDGMDVAEIVGDIERTWGIDIRGFRLGPDATVITLAQLIADRAQVEVEKVVPALTDILADRLSRDRATILASSRLVRDLGMG